MSTLRYFHTTMQRFLPRLPRRANPGIAYQIQQLDEVEPLSDDPEGFGNLESDFMHLQQTHKQHEAQMQKQRDRVRQFMVKHKYFREQKLPNLLTYAEKEQIRLLHARDPEEWTAERLAESFPATPDIIEKLLHAKWRPRNAQRIRAHDEGVIRNWELIRAGKYETPLPPELLEHLQKFADRKLEDLHTASAEQWPTRIPLPKPSGTEFQALITSCSKYAESVQQKQDIKLLPGEKNNTLNSTVVAPNEDETYLVENVSDKRKMRLQELKQFKLTEAELATSKQSKVEQQALTSLSNPSGTGIVRTPGNTGNEQKSLALPSFVNKFESSEIVITAADQKRFEMTKVKERIHIPKKLWRKGATYRVEDAYYDDDGEFLYRVPGMTGQKLNNF